MSWHSVFANLPLHFQQKFLFERPSSPIFCRMGLPLWRGRIYTCFAGTCTSFADEAIWDGLMPSFISLVVPTNCHPKLFSSRWWFNSYIPILSVPSNGHGNKRGEVCIRIQTNEWVKIMRHRRVPLVGVNHTVYAGWNVEQWCSVEIRQVCSCTIIMAA